LAATDLLDPIRRPKSASPNRTITSDLFDRLRIDILHCRLRPRARLIFRDLKEIYGTGVGPIREALMRLAADGLVVFEDHKGFTVAPVSREELEDIAITRCELEGFALRLAMERGDDSWESNVVARLYELTKRPTYTVEGELDVEWERRHDEFHRALYASCGLNWLQTFCRVLAERAYRYRHLLLDKVDRERDHRREHEAIADAAMNRRPEAVTLLQEHYRQTVAMVIGHWPDLT
jgi:DNA-binding GntR family transcriptional regulator